MKSDGNAKDLLIEIQKNKEKLIKDKKIKKEKPLKDIDGAELPFDIPKNWEWCKMGNIGDWGAGATPLKSESKYYRNGNIPWLLTGDLNDGYIGGAKQFITEIALKNNSLEIKPKGSVLIAMYGATIGKLAILDIAATTNQACCACIPFQGVHNKYIFYYLMFYKQLFINRGEGAAQPNISREKIINSDFALPPLAEQHRIVEKLDKIMPEIDEIAKIEKELVRISKKYPIDLKKSILKMAVSGKLTKQLKSDGNAEDLFAEIQKTKEQLVKDKKIKKEKQLKDIDETELPLEIPKNWKWCRLGDLGKYKKGPFGSSLTKSMFVKKDKNTIKVYEQKNAINKNAFIGDYYITNNYFKDKMKSFEVKANDIIVSCAGTIGETYIMPDNCEKGIINQALMMIDLYDKRLLKYYLVYFEIMVKYNAIKESNGSAIKNIPPFDILKNYYFPLPTIAEQNRIVEKLDSIMNELDGISNNIKVFENISK